MSPPPQRWKAAVLGAYVAAALGYLGWRVVFTMNPDAPVYSWAFLVLESYSALCAIIFYVVTWRRADPVPSPPPPGYGVDVFVCTYNEPTDLLRQTVRRAMAMDYPH